ncbi:MAG: hypothetical protein JNL61_07115, partial [Rhizobiaceae bacterium]|nr:hypothetical protein [Rhizobiaceae bacterium]
MNRVFVYLGRFALMILGFAVAAMAASAFLHLIWYGALGAPADKLGDFMAGPAFVSVPVVALFVGYFAFFPAMVVALLGELAGRRGWLF